MSQTTTPTNVRSDASRDIHHDDRARRLSTETKSSAEDFGTYDAWRLVTFLTIGYMLARGLAKAGSRQPYEE